MGFIPTDKTVIMGRSGCGKSFLARKLQAMWPRRVIFDSLNEYSHEKEKFSTFKGICERLKRARADDEQAFTLVFQFDPEADNGAVIFNELLRVLYYYGNLLIVVEEVQEFASTQFIPKWLRSCLLTGRHQGIGLMFTTQRPGVLNKTIVSQCGHIFCGNLIDRNDVKYVSNVLNQHAEKLVNLKDRNFIYRSPDGITEISTEKRA